MTDQRLIAAAPYSEKTPEDYNNVIKIVSITVSLFAFTIHNYSYSLFVSLKNCEFRNRTKMARYL